MIAKGTTVLQIVVLLLCSAAILRASDEQTVRTAYAKLAYAAQARTVYMLTRSNPKLDSNELSRQLQAEELRFEITELKAGPLSEIISKPYSDFVTPTDGQPVLSIAIDTESFDENGKRSVSNFAFPHWEEGERSSSDWTIPVGQALSLTKQTGKFSRYVTACITVRYQGKSRTYQTLWLFGTETLPIDTVTGNNILADFVTKSAFPSILTDTSLHSHAAVSAWLSANQKFSQQCKKGKQDVCCDSDHCGVSSSDLMSSSPAPTMTATPKEER